MLQPSARLLETSEARTLVSMTALVIFFFVSVTIVAALTNNWDAIASLPESTAAFLGALAGVGGGLLAILAGALLNAHLNRKRDDRLRNVEIVAVTNALDAELMKFHSFSSEHAAKLRQPPLNTFGAIAVGRPLSAPIFEKMTGHQLGLLDTDALRNLVEVHYRHELLTGFIDDTIAMVSNLDEIVDDNLLEKFVTRHNDLAQAAMTARRALSSSVSKL